MAALIKIVEENPNDVTGGGGCLCSEVANLDTNGPFAVFVGDTEMDSIVSPSVVACAGCLREACRLMEDYEAEQPILSEAEELH